MRVIYTVTPLHSRISTTHHTIHIAMMSYATYMLRYHQYHFTLYSITYFKGKRDRDAGHENLKYISD